MESKHAKNIANFETLTIILDELGINYRPAETIILPAALRDRLEEAKAVFEELNAARAARDRILYDPDTGILKLVKLIRGQLARNPGKTSPFYRQIIALEFRKY